MLEASALPMRKLECPRTPCEPVVATQDLTGSWIPAQLGPYHYTPPTMPTASAFRGPVTLELPDGTKMTTKSQLTADIDTPWKLEHDVVLEDRDFVKPLGCIPSFRFLTMNGLSVLLVSDRRAADDTMHVALPVGFTCPPEDKPGIAHLVEHCLVTWREP